MSKKKKPPRLQFMPTNLSTDLGTASYDPRTGNVSTKLSDDLAQFRDFFWDSAMDFAPSEEQSMFADNVTDYGMGIFNRAANLDINKMTSDYYNQMQSNLAPSRAMEEARLADTLFKTGRTGYGTGYMGGGYVNPEQFALLKAREEANAGMLMAAEDRSRAIQQQDITAAGQYLNLGNALSLQPYQNVGMISGMGTEIAGQGVGLLNPLSAFANTQFGWQSAKQQNDAARAAASGGGFGGFLGGLGGGLLSSATSVLGQGLGQWALNTYLPGAGTVASAALSSYGPGAVTGARSFLR